MAEIMGVTINVTVLPAMTGRTVELWYYFFPDWFKFYSKLTDSYGNVKLTAAATSYPIDLKIIVPAQTMGGIEYKEQYKVIYLNDGEVENLIFTMVPVSPPTEEGKGEIIEVSLPAELPEGSYVEGYFRIKNVGTATAKFRSRLVTEWNGKQSIGPETDLASNGVLRINLAAGGIVMPAQDAVITIYAQRLKDGVWVIDDTKSH